MRKSETKRGGYDFIRELEKIFGTFSLQNTRLPAFSGDDTDEYSSIYHKATPPLRVDQFN
jgi:hypothetical protein